MAFNENFGIKPVQTDDERKQAIKMFEDILPDTEEVRKLNEEAAELKAIYNSIADGTEKIEIGERMREIAVALWHIAQQQEKKPGERSVQDILDDNPDLVRELPR